MLEHPGVIFVLSLATLVVAAYAGVYAGTRLRAADAAEREQFGIVLTAALTLLGLVVGFTFSMAVSRYDQRKNLEADEANAIGTEYVRVDLLGVERADALHALLAAYLDERVLSYTTADAAKLVDVDGVTAHLQSELWAEAKSAAVEQPNVNTALVTSGMNDVLNSQAYTQAAWWNRIPLAAWLLMGAIAVICNFLFGYSQRPRWRALVILPVLLATAFYLIAELDSPRGGLVRVAPLNLVALRHGLPGNRN
jgi:FtsH-binding integral membrane protein